MKLFKTSYLKVLVGTLLGSGVVFCACGGAFVHQEKLRTTVFLTTPWSKPHVMGMSCAVAPRKEVHRLLCCPQRDSTIPNLQAVFTLLPGVVPCARLSCLLSRPDFCSRESDSRFDLELCSYGTHAVRSRFGVQFAYPSELFCIRLVPQVFFTAVDNLTLHPCLSRRCVGRLFHAAARGAWQHNYSYAGGLGLCCIPCQGVMLAARYDTCIQGHRTIHAYKLGMYMSF